MQDQAGLPTAAITRRIARASAWKLDKPFAQENYQVMNYGPGGLISFHTDEVPLSSEIQTKEQFKSYWFTGGPRLATSMIYLKSPQTGGRTVFPFIKLSVPPSPHALLFWHNVTPDGSPDTRAMHAACPVVRGDKWIMNKWVKLTPHWDSHQCQVKDRDSQGAFSRWGSMSK